jgi:hypothetical protein
MHMPFWWQIRPYIIEKCHFVGLTLWKKNVKSGRRKKIVSGCPSFALHLSMSSTNSFGRHRCCSSSEGDRREAQLGWGILSWAVEVRKCSDAGKFEYEAKSFMCMKRN